LIWISFLTSLGSGNPNLMKKIGSVQKLDHLRASYGQDFIQNLRFIAICVSITTNLGSLKSNLNLFLRSGNLFLEILIFFRGKLMMWPGECSESKKKLFLFSNHFLDINQPFYIQKYERNVKNVNFQPFETENF
jgi:hypothetical protein